MKGQVIMHGTGTGSFALDVESVNGNAILATTTFAAVPSSTSTIATLNIDPSISPTASSTLNIDFNGDGIIDSTLKAKEGSVVLPDITPPQIQFSFSTTTHSLTYRAIDDSGSVTATSTTTFPAKSKKDQKGKENGSNNLATTTITATDSTGNTATLVYTQQSSTPNGNQQINAILTSITYNSITTPITNTTLSYLFKLEDNNSYDLFASYLKAGTTAFESHFIPDTNRTVFMANPQPLTSDEIGSRAIKQTLKGFVVPFVSVSGGGVSVVD
jgi:hypothetical protein